MRDCSKNPEDPFFVGYDHGERAREVLKLVGERYKNKEISDYLCISVKTVEKHRSNIMRKLDVHNASALTAIAIEKGLVNKAAAA